MDNKKIFKKALYTAFPNTIPVLTGFLVLGTAYGVLMLKSGYGTLWSVMMSALAFCGSMQFVAITLLTTVFNPIQAFMLSIMVNARHLFYGLAMLEKYRGLGKARFFLIYTLCDETFSISSSIALPEDVDRKYFYLSISLLNYLYWVLGTFIGSILGRFITFNTKGLDFVLTALFVVLFLEQLKKKENRISGIIGVVAAAAALLVFGTGNMVIPAMIIILLILLVGREKICC
ncbi:MAG: branched-chain amino acid transporter AzlC [Clostridiales bacterium]|nr:branched-chain amino acid transporter AzlC [Clostridiales bacterium]